MSRIWASVTAHLLHTVTNMNCSHSSPPPHYVMNINCGHSSPTPHWLSRTWASVSAHLHHTVSRIWASVTAHLFHTMSRILVSVTAHLFHTGYVTNISCSHSSPPHWLCHEHELYYTSWTGMRSAALQQCDSDHNSTLTSLQLILQLPIAENCSNKFETP
jgi:hypothetical protein